MHRAGFNRIVCLSEGHSLYRVVQQCISCPDGRHAVRAIITIIIILHTMSTSHVHARRTREPNDAAV